MRKPDRQRGQGSWGQLVYVYAAVGRCWLETRPRFSWSNGVRAALTGYNVVVANNGFTAAAWT